MKVANAAAQMGMDTAPEIEKFVTSVAKISIATGALPEQVGQDFAKIKKILGDSELDFEGFGSAISALTDTHNINFEDLVSNTKKVADNFTGMATTAPEIAALVASFTEISGTAREAASQLQGVVDAMRDPTKIEDFAEALGLTTEQFETMRDNDFVGLLGQIATKLGDGSANADTLKDLLGESANKVEILGQNWGDVESSVHLANVEYETARDLQEDFNIKVTTFGSGVKILQNNVEDMKTAVGENLVPSMQKLVDVFTENKQGIEDFFTSMATGLANSFVWIIENKDAVIMGIVAIVAAFAAMKLEGVISNLGKIAAAFDPIKLATLAIGAGIGLFVTRIIQSNQEAARLRQHMEAIAEAEREAAEQAQKEAQYREWITSQTADLAPIRQQTAQIISEHEVQDVAGATYGEMFSTDYRYIDYTKANADTAAVADRMTELAGKARQLGLSAGATAALIADLQGAATAALTSPEGSGLAAFNEMAGQIVAAYDEVIPGVSGMIDESTPVVEKATRSWAKFAEKLGLVVRKTNEAGEEMIELGETGQIVADTFGDIVGGAINEYLNQADEYQAALDQIKEEEQTAVDEAAKQRDEELAALQKQLDEKLISEEEYNTQHQAILDAYTTAETTAHDTASQALKDEETAYKETRKSIWEVLKQMAKDVLTSLRESLFLKAAAAAGEALALGFAAIFDPLLWPAVGAKVAEAAAYTGAATGLAIAGFDKGGVFTSPTILPAHAVAESGPEAFLPLNEGVFSKIGSGIVTAMSAQPASGIQVDMRGLYDGATINVRDDLDIKKIARETYNLYATRLRSAGATI